MIDTRRADLDEYMELVARHQVALRSFVARLSPRTDRVDDLAQEVFVRAIDAFDRYRAEAEILPWLRGIARNVCREAWRGATGAASPERLEIALEDAAERDAAERARAEAGDARLDALRLCVDSLPAGRREYFEMRHRTRLTSAEMAERLGRTAEAVDCAMLRLRRWLRNCVETRLGEART